MNLTKGDFEKIEKALQLLPYGDAFDGLSKEEQDIIVDADTVMRNLLRKQRADNERTARAIANKRKTNPMYARSKSEKAKYKN